MTRRVGQFMHSGRLASFRRLWGPGETPAALPLGFAGKRRKLPDGSYIDRFDKVPHDPGRTWRLQGGINWLDWNGVHHASNELERALPLLPTNQNFGPEMNFRDATSAGYIDDKGQWLTVDTSGTYLWASTELIFKVGSWPANIVSDFATKFFVFEWENKAGFEAFTGNDVAGGILSGVPWRFTLGLTSAFTQVLGPRKLLLDGSLVTTWGAIQWEFAKAAANGGDISKLDSASLKIRESDSNGNVIYAPDEHVSKDFQNAERHFDVIRYLDLGTPYGPARTHHDMVRQDDAYQGNGGVEQWPDGARGNANIQRQLNDAQAVGAEAWIFTPAWMGSPVNSLFTSRTGDGAGFPVSFSGDLSGPHAVAGSFTKGVDIGDAVTTVNADGTFTYTPNGNYTLGRQAGFSFNYTDVLKGPTGPVELHFLEEFGRATVRWSNDDASNATSLANAPVILDETWHREYVKWFLDQLQASNYPEGKLLYIERANEIWNFGNNWFAQNTRHHQGVGQWLIANKGLSGDSRTLGAGWLDGMFMKVLAEEQATRGTNYKVITMATGQEAGTSTLTGRLDGAIAYFTDQLIDPALYVNPDNYVGAVAIYLGGATDPGANRVSGQLDDASNLAWWQDRIQNSPAGLLDEVIQFYLKPTPEPFNVAWHIQQLEAHNANCVARGTVLRAAYEGGSGDETPVNMRDDAVFRPWYIAEYPKAMGAAINALFSQTITKWPDFMLSQFQQNGEYGPFSGPTSPWNYGPRGAENEIFDAVRKFGKDPLL